MAASAPPVKLARTDQPPPCLPSAAPLPHRAWRSAGGGTPASEDGGPPPLTVATFNVQAEAFEYEASPWDPWRVRCERLIAAALQQDPDVICLQEVDHFDDFFEPELGRRGYAGHFVPKTKNPKKPHLPTEGQAIFVRAATLEVRDRYCWTSLNLTKNKRLLNLWKAALRPDQDGYKTVFGTDAKLQMLPQVVLGLVLRPRLPDGFGPELLCTSLHLKSTVKQVILDQLGVSAEELKLHQFEAFVEAARRTVGEGVPLLCCGDLNQPMSAGGLCAAVAREGFVDAYGGATPQGHADPIDFILLGGGQGLLLDQFLELPTPSELRLGPGRRLPNEVYPSDHLLLAARFRLQAGRATPEQPQA